MATKQDLKAKALKELEEEQKRLLEQKKKAAEQAKANKEADLIGAKDAAKLNKNTSVDSAANKAKNSVLVKSGSSSAVKQTASDRTARAAGGQSGIDKIEAAKREKATAQAKANKEKDLPGFDGYAYQRAKQQQIEKEKTEYLNIKEARDKKSALEKELADLRNKAKEEGKKAGTVAIVASGRKGGAGSVISAETESEIDRLEKEIIDLDKNINLADRAQSKKYLKNSALKAEDFEDYSYEAEKPEKRYYKSPAQKRETETVKGYMNEEERKIYNYYYNKFGKEKAEEYFESIRGDLNMREAVAIFMGNEGKTANQYLMGAAAGLDQAKSGYQNAMRMLFGDEKTDPTSVYQYLSGMAREDLADKGPKLPEALGGASLGQIGFDAVNTGANMLPSLMLGTLGGGAIGAAAIGTSAAGNAYSEALSAGYGKEQATNYAALVGASEAALGYLLGGIEAQGGKLSKAALSKVLPKIDGALAKASVALPTKMLSEFSEEYLQEVLTPVFENIAFEEENKIDLLSPEAIYSGIMGALTAGASAVADGSAFGTNIAADIPVPFDGKAQPGTEAGLVAEKIAEIEKSSLTESEKAEKMAKIAEAVAETTASEDVIAEVEKFRNIHEEKAAEESREITEENLDKENAYNLTEDDLSDYLRAGGRTNKNKLQALQDGKDIILTTKNQITDYIKKAISGAKDLATAAYGKVTNRLANDVLNYSAGKIDVKGNYLELVPYDVQHAYEQHLNAKEPGDINLTLEDFENIPEYLNNYDDIVYAIKFASGNTRVCVSKKLSNGRVLLIETVSKSRGAMQFKNMIGVSEEKYAAEYVNEYKKRNTSNSRGDEGPNISLRDDYASTDIIRPDSENYNPQDEENIFEEAAYNKMQETEDSVPSFVRADIDRIANDPSIDSEQKVFDLMKLFDNAKSPAEKAEIGRYIYKFKTEPEKATAPVIAENEAVDISAEVVASAKRVAERVYQRRQEEKAAEKQAKAEENQSSTGQVNPEENESKAANVPQSEKSKRIERRYQRAVEDGVASVFGVSRKDLKGDIRPILDEIAADVKDGKKISDEQIDRLYKQAFDDGIITEEFPQYDSTRKYIRETPIYVDKKTRDEFGEDREFLDFTRSNIGNFKITTDPRARHLDSFYDELSKEAPDWFSEDEIDPKTQLEDIADFMDKTKKQYMGLSERYGGSELADFEIWAKKELHALMEEYGKGLETVERYERDRQIKADHKAKEMNGDASFEAAKKAFENRKVFNARKAVEEAKANALLNDNDLWLVKRLHEGTISEGDVFEGAQNREGVLEVYKAEKAYKEAIAPFVQYSVSFKQSVQHDAIEAIKYSDDFNDKGGKLGGLRYQRETAERNILDITDGGKSGGKAIIENYIEPVHEHEAMATRFIKEMNQRVKDLELGHLNRYERAYTQMIGENSVYLSEGRITKHNKKEHEALNAKILELLEAYGDKIDKEKCEKAAAGFMAIYEDLLERWNNERIRLGQEPVGNIEAYFPHFELAKPETKLQKFFAEKLGMEIGNSKLPTEIAGRTAGRKPKSKYNPHAKRRLGDLTDYDVLKGFDGYLRTVAHNIYHTEDIIKLRALSDSIRAKYSDESISDKIKAIINREDLSEADRANLIAEAIEKVPDKFHLSNFVAWLDDYTNIIAGKKSYGDREMEFALGREMYDISRALEGRIASNMIGWNASTPAMNLVPLFQATADLSPAEIISSLAQTAVSALKRDSYISDNSDFLTNRFGYETLYKQNYNLFSAENIAERVSKMQDGGAFFMELTDRIVSESLVRGRLQHNLKKGLTTEEAFSEADQWAAGLIADRSLGALPTVFEKKNPVMKALTMFQIESNNQWSYIFKDAGKYKWEKEGAINTITGQLVFWAAMAICRALSDEFLGKEDAVPDPIGITADAIEKLQKGEQVGDVLFDTATSIVKQMPVIGSYLGGGRISLSAAAPDFENLSKLLNDNVSGAKKGEIILDGLIKPLMYIIAPTGWAQVNKTRQSIENIARGGAYGTEADGDRYMKFAQEYDPASIVKNLLFGPYAAYAGQNYIDSGFKDKLSAEQTKQMEIAHKEYGMPKDVFYETVLGLKPYKKEAEKQEALFNNPDITASQKDIIDYLLFGKPTTKAIENDVVAPERVYTSEEGFYRSGLSDADKRLFDAGYREKEIEAIDKGYDRGRNKGEKIDNIQNALGCSKAEAFEIYSRKTGNWNDELPKEETERAEKAAEFYGMSTEKYLTVLNLSKFGAQTKDGYSTKAEDVIPNIAEVLEISKAQAEEYYNQVVTFEYSKADLSEENAKKLETAGGWYDVDEKGYFTARNVCKDISGKDAQIKEIAKQLKIDEQEATIYYLAAKGDLALSKEDLSEAKKIDITEAVKHGWTEKQFLDAVNILKITGVTKKDEIIQALLNAGASYEMALGYYNLSKNYDYYKRG